MSNFRKVQEKWERDSLNPLAKKSEDAKRWKTELSDSYRTEYQRDVGRILFSDAFRRLRMKTQVFVANNSNQHNRTRLTHSLEVAHIAKSIAKPLFLNNDLVEAIALGHDLGHTPFGHAGEFALRKCLEGKGSFHHNVQSVWILRKALCYRKDINGKLIPGYNLTHDVAEGIWKHTDYKNTVGEIEGLIHYKPDEPSSLEGQVVDVADGIAYLMHDIEDGARQRLIRFCEVEEVWKKYMDIPFSRNGWGHHLICDVISNSNEQDEIKFSDDMAILYEQLKKLVDKRIINSTFVQKKDEEGKEKITTIYEYCSSNPDYIGRKYSKRNNYYIKKYGIERVIVDFIQWLGDSNADNLYQNIVNSKGNLI